MTDRDSRLLYFTTLWLYKLVALLTWSNKTNPSRGLFIVHFIFSQASIYLSLLLLAQLIHPAVSMSLHLILDLKLNSIQHISLHDAATTMLNRLNCHCSVRTSSYLYSLLLDEYKMICRDSRTIKIQATTNCKSVGHHHLCQSKIPLLSTWTLRGLSEK